MPIELLYIIPIVALAFLILLLVLNAQKRQWTGFKAGPPASADGRLPGDTKFLASRRTTEERLNEYEQTISQVNKSLANQQKVIEKFQEENSSYNNEIGKLEAKLRELHKEYDIVISENFSLRAKVKSLQRKIEIQPILKGDVPLPQATTSAKEHAEMNMNLYEDTKLFKSSTPDDQEFDITER